MDLPSRLDLYAIGRNYVLQRATKIDPAQIDTQGSDANIFVGSTSLVADKIVKQLGYSVNRLLLDGASAEDLDRYAFDRYGIVRKGASPAVGVVRIFRASAAIGAGTVPAGTKLQTLSGVQYLTTTDASFGSGDLTTVANVRAAQAGKVTQVGANMIRTFGNAGTLFDKTLQVTNDLVTAGGENDEDDDTFRNRIRNFWNTARRGILAAIEFGALTVPGVVSAQAIEALNGGAMPARVVNLYIADSSGVASEVLGAAVRTALEDYRAAGIAVIISMSLPFIADITIALSYRAGVDTVSLGGQVKAAVVEFVNSLGVNGTLYTGQLYSVIQRFAADGVIAPAGCIIAPAGDLVPAIGQTIRTTLANVTVTTA